MYMHLSIHSIFKKASTFGLFSVALELQTATLR
jgi:hypothetical protein